MLTCNFFVFAAFFIFSFNNICALFISLLFHEAFVFLGLFASHNLHLVHFIERVCTCNHGKSFHFDFDLVPVYFVLLLPNLFACHVSVAFTNYV